MKVMHIITGLGSGGAENALLRLVSNSSGIFNHVIVSLGAESQLSKSFEATRCKVYYLNMKSGRFSIRKIRGLSQIISNEHPQIVQTWMYHSDFIGGLVGWFKKIPVIWSIRQDQPTIALNGLTTWMIAKCCALLSYFIPKVITCNSNRAIANHCSFGYARSKFFCIPNGFQDKLTSDTNNIQGIIRKDYELKESDVVIGHVARYHPVKNHLGFINAFKEIQPTHTALKAIMVGLNIDFSNAALFSEVPEVMKDRFVLLGARNDVASIYGMFDFFVMNSHAEAFPNVVAEAMLCGVPCIVTDVGDAAEIVGQTGWVIKPDNQAALVSALNDALGLSVEERKQKGDAARQRILSCYSIRNMVTQFELVWSKNIK